MSLTDILPLLFSWLVVGVFAYGFGVKRGAEDARDGRTYRDDEDDSEM